MTNDKDSLKNMIIPGIFLVTVCVILSSNLRPEHKAVAIVVDALGSAILYETMK
ncbi:hypothetical protein M1O20_01270 [Dehalococcoidia bacterium]|nr:hypothetical protein [Dehalococcoidia bacterium]